MKRVVIMLSAFCLIGCANSSQQAVSTSDTAESTTTVEDTTPNVAYKKYDFGEYAENGSMCVGYNVVFIDSVDDQMGAMQFIWDELTSNDGYDCHTIWFYSNDDIYNTSGYDIGMWEQSSGGSIEMDNKY